MSPPRLGWTVPSIVPLQVDFKSSCYPARMPPDGLLTIGQIAAQAGLRTSALRYYEGEGLLRPAARVGGQRRYRPDAVEQLAVIGFRRELGFSLGEIRRLLEQPRGGGQRRSWRALVDEKLAEMAAAAARAEAMRMILER